MLQVGQELYKKGYNFYSIFVLKAIFSSFVNQDTHYRLIIMSVEKYIAVKAVELTKDRLEYYLELADEQNTWADYILQDSANAKYWEQLYLEFPEYQFFLLDGEKLVGCGNCVPLHLEDANLYNLPDTGWNWALSQAFVDKGNDKRPNILSALQIAISPEYRGKGISELLVKTMKGIALEEGFKQFVLPVRPNLKHKYPLIDIDEYMKWKNGDGLPYDAWIRVHARNGGQILKSCRKSMFVSGTIAEWEEWTGYDLKSSGQYLFPSALIPIEVDVEKDKATYCEPNVWMYYEL